jgi:glycosyltransferase involved in cell wall biosynthesis
MKLGFATPERKVIVVMPAYNAAQTLVATMREMPRGSFDQIILVDDGSRDQTVAIARELGIDVACHDRNRGYGANQKTCYRRALEAGADIVVMLHPDNQYNPAIIPNMVLPIYLEQAEVVLASRFIHDPLRGGPVAGGMPLLKYFVNRLLSTGQNWLMGTYFSEFHTGYRAFDAKLLAQIDLTGLDDGFLFDNQIIAVLAARKARFAQIGVETRYFP